MRQASQPGDAMRRGLKYRWKGVMSCGRVWRVGKKRDWDWDGMDMMVGRGEVRPFFFSVWCASLSLSHLGVPPYLQRTGGSREEAEGDVRPGDGREL